MFLGRPWPTPGEPLFTREDTDWAIALAEEEADTCPSCGYPKVWCRDPAHQFAFDADEAVCWATYRLELRRGKHGKEHRDPATAAATQMSARFRDGHTPDVGAGLNLEELGMEEASG